MTPSQGLKLHHAPIHPTIAAPLPEPPPRRLNRHSRQISAPTEMPPSPLDDDGRVTLLPEPPALPVAPPGGLQTHRCRLLILRVQSGISDEAAAPPSLHEKTRKQTPAVTGRGRSGVISRSKPGLLIRLMGRCCERWVSHFKKMAEISDFKDVILK